MLNRIVTVAWIKDGLILKARCSLVMAFVIGLAYSNCASAQPALNFDEPVPISKLLAPPKPDLSKQPWLDTKRDPDTRADLLIAELTLDEKIQLVHGTGMLNPPLTSNGGAGYVPGIKRVGLPDLNLADSTVGVTRGAQSGRYSTLMPAAIAEAAAWDPKLSYDYGALIARELRAQGYNVTLAGGANLAREPRNGRTFEYRGEDPLLTGKLVAQAIRGVQDQKVIGDLKHYALNDQETGRHTGNVIIDERAARESDLLAFEIAVKEAQPGMVMCSYNKVAGDYACENSELLTRLLKGEWGFKGWVVSDWGATHSTEKALLAGLDQEQPGSKYFGDKLKEAIESGRLPESALNAAVKRILRTMFAVGVVDVPVKRSVVDVAAGERAAQAVAEKGTVLLKNARDLLPISGVKAVAVIGGHADVGVLTGGGSGQVDPPGGNAVKSESDEVRISSLGLFFPKIWWPSSPLNALRAAAPDVKFIFDDGSDPARAAAVARNADMAIVFAYAPSSEEHDNESLSLPDRQDGLIDAVVSANGRSVVVLETTGPVTMPWADKTGAIVAAWFPGARGGEAIANLLTGKVNFSAKLPITFPKSEADLPHPVVQGSKLTPVAWPDSLIPGMKTKPPFDIRYDEGALVGYKWFEAKGKKPLFAFGHGLSYTTFAYADLALTPESATFTVTNTGTREGVETAQVYASLPARVRLVPKQLVGWDKVSLSPGEARRVTVKFETLALSAFDVERRVWTQPKGVYKVVVGGSSDNTPLAGSFSIK